MANYEAIFRYPINGSPTQIEVSPGLTSEKGPIPGALVRFVEDGEELFCVCLDDEDIQTLILMLMDCRIARAESKGGSKQMPTADPPRSAPPCRICGGALGWADWRRQCAVCNDLIRQEMGEE